MLLTESLKNGFLSYLDWLVSQSTSFVRADCYMPKHSEEYHRDHNRHHDEEASEIADRHDKIKELNRLEREKKEKERLEKYDKPFKIKDDTHALQMELHRLLTEYKDYERDHNWKQKFNMVRELSQEMGIWDGFVKKYQLNRRGLD